MAIRLSVASIAAGLLIMTGCAKEPQVGDIVGTSDDPITLVSSEDPEMAAVVAKSRETVSEFIAALENPPANANSFAVKKEFVDGDQSEFMWLTGVTFENDQFTGTLDNDPQMVRNAQNGEQYSVKANEIHDWLFFEGDELRGGYSVKLLQQRMEAN